MQRRANVVDRNVGQNLDHAHDSPITAPDQRVLLRKSDAATRDDTLADEAIAIFAETGAAPSQLSRVRAVGQGT